MRERDAPRYRVWPPVALGAPFVVGILLGEAWPWSTGLPASVRDVAALALAALFALVNGAAYGMMVRARTGILPGHSAQRILDRGPFAFSRNPLYVGLLLLYLALALYGDSAWALALFPFALALVHWGAVLPEERYLDAKFGDAYRAYRARVRRWL